MLQICKTNILFTCFLIEHIIYVYCRGLKIRISEKSKTSITLPPEISANTCVCVFTYMHIYTIHICMHVYFSFVYFLKHRIIIAHIL